MDVFRTLASWQVARAAMDGAIGFVPTMGALHEGHLSLIRWVREVSDVVVVELRRKSAFGVGGEG